jgi:hypothetical protein
VIARPGGRRRRARTADGPPARHRHRWHAARRARAAARRHRDAIADASAQGIEIALVTGRAFHFMRAVIDRLPVPLTLIVNNGAVVKRKTGETEWRHVLDREAARRILAETRHLEDSVAVVFDRPGERQIMFERMDWTHPNRRGYYEKNKAYITAATAPLADVLTEDPIQVMFNGSVEPMRALFTTLRRCRSPTGSRWRSPSTRRATSRSSTSTARSARRGRPWPGGRPRRASPRRT